MSGGELSKDLPKGKTWLKTYSRMNLTTMSGWFGQLVSPVEPGTLAALVKNGRRSGSTYTGKITFDQLAKVSNWFNGSMPQRPDTEATVTYTLRLDGRGLPSRLTTSWTATDFLDIPQWDEKTVTTETRYSHWGVKVSIRPPAKATVTTSLKD
ncbi:hypothetical protein [Nonomuraea rhizosphaerae]|uniref:hypothetical protein n=1 Tax=Nonomuraea rhizosphaerae TaxID=2665663 RepID=UPI001C5DF689|nr:hypothetical protein [Nonomuraea rhizosphaerae]